MHFNSKKALYEERSRLSERESQIYEMLRVTPNDSRTDRQIMVRLGFSEPNQVRPRITELINKGLLMECGQTTCLETRKTVRLVKLYSDNNQMEMF